MASTKKNKASDLRNKTKKELEVMLEEKNQELMNIRFKRAVARLEKPAHFRNLKKDRARIMTVLREKRS